jgi:hypothetical protein
MIAKFNCYIIIGMTSTINNTNINTNINANINSWVDLIDCTNLKEELLNNTIISEKPKNEKNEEIETTIIDIDKILLLKPEQLTSLDCLKHSLTILFNLKKNIQTMSQIHQNKPITINEYKSYIPNLTWLNECFYFLAKKLGLETTEYKNKFIADKEDSIKRSSYKFCEFNHNCEFNYNHLNNKSKQEKKKNYTRGCYAHHFVYGSVYIDLKIIIDYLNKSSNINNTELIKSLNTLIYVVNHMKEELTQLKIKYNDYEKYHREGSAIIFNRNKKN